MVMADADHPHCDQRQVLCCHSKEALAAGSEACGMQGPGFHTRPPVGVTGGPLPHLAYISLAWGTVEGRRGRLWKLGHPWLMAPDSHFPGVKSRSSLPTNYLEVFQSLGPKRDFLGDLGWTGRAFPVGRASRCQAPDQDRGLVLHLTSAHKGSLFTDFLVLMASTEPPATGAPPAYPLA